MILIDELCIDKDKFTVEDAVDPTMTKTEDTDESNIYAAGVFFLIMFKNSKILNSN